MTIENIGISNVPQVVVKENSNQKIHVLAVDDDEINLEVLNHILHENGYDVSVASDGEEGLLFLQDHAEQIDVILLDKMMPNMDGIEFLKKIKSYPEIANIPVIMQTAAVSSEDVVEGLEAGAYYYVTKPFDENVLISIINAACIDKNKQLLLEQKVAEEQAATDMVVESIFKFQTIDQAHVLAGHLANYFPNPANVAVGLLELLINAVEHGNLAIGYDAKNKLLSESRLQHEIFCRLNLPENLEKFVTVTLHKYADKISVSIKDEGDGFNYKNYFSFDPIRMTDANGRGIAKANAMSFDKLTYNEQGNQVTGEVWLFNKH